MLVYLDDILICSKSEEEHVQQIKQVLQVLRNSRFYDSKAKCHFGKEKLHYLGHVVGNKGIKGGS